MDAPKPHRRWFRFSLRTLFVVVAAVAALVAIVLVQERRVVQARAAALFSVQVDGAMVTLENNNSRVWWWRRLLGDQAVKVIRAPREWNPDRRAELAQLFPEAEIVEGRFLSSHSGP